MVFVKILILLEAVFALYAVVVLFVFRADTALAALYLNEMILSVLAHLPTPLTLIFMLHKFERNRALSFLRSWWLLSSLVLEIVLCISAWVDFPSPATVEKNLLFAYTLVSVFVSGAAFVFYMILFFMQWMTGRKSASSGVMAAAEENVQSTSPMTFNNGVANLRFPLPANARIVHQPRKDI